MRAAAAAWVLGLAWALPGIVLFCVWRSSDGWLANTAAVLCCGYVIVLIALGLRAETGSRLSVSDSRASDSRASDSSAHDSSPGAAGTTASMTLPAQRVIPTLRIIDYARSRAFYEQGLSFRIEWEHRFGPQFPVFVSLVRDGMRLFLSQHAGDCQVGGLVHFVVADVDACHREFTGRGIVASEAPNTDLGFPNMTVTDPDGNQLRFFTPPPEPR